MMIWKRMLAIGAGALVLALGAVALRACFGPDTAIVFTWERHPDLPLERYAAGHIGILQPFYARSYLVVAYRYFIGKPLAQQEQQDVVDQWDERLNQAPDPRNEPMPSATPELSEQWVKARSKFMKGPQPEVLKEIKLLGREQWVDNIQDGAFRLCMRTLDDRVRRWGAGDRRLKAWIAAQDQVFHSTPGHPDIPTADVQPPDPLLRRDRAYQVASARFYAQDFDRALKDFALVAQDSESPWARIAAYMKVRCCYRKGRLLEESDPERSRKAFQEALDRASALAGEPYGHRLGRRLRAIWKDMSSAAQEEQAVAEAAQDLAQASASRQDPVREIRGLAARLPWGKNSGDFGNDVGTYTDLLDSQITGEEAWDEFHHAKEWMHVQSPAVSRAIPRVLLKDDLTDWVFSFRELGRSAYGHARERWRATQSVPWLVAALAKAGPESRDVDALIAAAGALEPNHPAYPMAAFHKSRLLLAQGHAEAARPVLDGLVRQGAEGVTPAGLNLCKALRARLARTDSDLVQDLLRVPAGIEWPRGEESVTNPMDGGDPRLAKDFPDQVVALDHREGQRFFQSYGPHPAFLQEDGAWLLNEKIPTAALIRLARDSQTPPHLHREWLRCAWVRAVLTGQLDLAQSLAPELQELEPQLAPSMAAFRETPPSSRAVEGLWILLHYPGLRWFVGQSVESRTYVTPGQTDQWNWEKGGTLRSRHPFRDNWWPSLADLRQADDSSFWFGQTEPFARSLPLLRVFGPRRPEAPAFQTAEEAQETERELNALAGAGNGPAWLCRETARWAQAQPEDPRIPEALHLAVRASRTHEAKPWARTCFALLHGRYKDTPWAKRTPVYY